MSILTPIDQKTSRIKKEILISVLSDENSVIFLFMVFRPTRTARSAVVRESCLAVADISGCS